MINTANKFCKNNTSKSVLLYERIRIPIKSLYRNAAFASEIGLFLMSLKGIIEVNANPLTSRVLVIFNEKKIGESDIKRSIGVFIKKRTIVHDSNVIQIKNINLKEEYALPIFEEDITEPENKESLKYNRSWINDTDQILWHNLEEWQIEAILNTNFKIGLNTKLLEDKVKEYGLNVLTEMKRKSFIAKFIENLKDFSATLLLGVSIVSFFLGQIPDAIAVLGIVILETTLGTIQQYKSEKSIHSLKDILVHKAAVIRNGKEQYVDAKYLVPGDIIILVSGNKIPADARIIESYDLSVLESSLTGEATSVLKSSAKCDKFADLGDRSNMLYMGTDVMGGKGRAVIVATGMNTEIGKIAAMLQNIQIEPTPLQRKMMQFVNQLTKICFLGCAVISGIGILSGKNISQMLTMSVSFSIGALPESLPAVVTVAMTLSVQRIAKHNAVVRKLPAVETLGAANVICCDKTGTLTMNEMTVKRLYIDRCLYELSGSGYDPQGKISLIKGDVLKKSSLEKILSAGIICNNSTLIRKKAIWTIQGDPTEGALLIAARKYDLEESIIRKENVRVKEIPFDSQRKYMTVEVEHIGERIAYCKGALDCIIEKCKRIYEDGNERLFTSTDKDKLLKLCDQMGENALRVLALAYKKININAKWKKDPDHNFVFLGLVGMEDPPRKGIRRSIEKCHKAGIKVVMITGDHKNTASAIGRNIGLLTDGIAITGNELDDMTDEEFYSKMHSIQIFARTSPEQKFRIVKSFKRLGYVVAMTGDGVNDAPAIKEANIGIAMGRNGSDVVREAADITLVDDDFSTIVKAIEEGRAVTSNIKNSMKYLLAGSLGEILALGLCSTISRLLPLISIQILWVNVISESILGGCLSTEPCNEDIMNDLPAKPDEPLINKALSYQIMRRGLGIGLTTFMIFEGSMLFGAGLTKARTLAFTNLISSHLVNVYDCKMNKKILSNQYMNIAAFATITMLLGTIYLPFLNPFFGTQALNLFDWAGVAGMTMISRI